MPRLKPKIRLEPPEIRRWGFLRAIAHFEGAWQTCRHGECRARKRCTGGPRGTFRKKAVPLCRRHAPPEWWAELEGVMDG
jgi:hypothetical protein